MDQSFMQRALALAEMGEGNTSPNPMVGAVVVQDGCIVGEGYHPKAGMPHAEVYAINAAGDSAHGADLYVTLEPCCHFGRTPPCTQKIIAAGIRRVFVATLDPNPKVAGKGVWELRNAGLDVHVGMLEPQAIELNEGFLTYMATGQPFVTVKWAMTLDGKISTRTGDSRSISSVQANLYTHRLRARHDAILVGVDTVQTDNPSLTCRLPGYQGRQPTRIILDSTLRVEPKSTVLSDHAAPTLVVCSRPSREKLNTLQALGVDVLLLPPGPDGRPLVKDLMTNLASRGIQSVLVEGGAQVHWSFLSAQAADKLLVYIAPKVVGGAQATAPVGGLGVELIEQAIRPQYVEHMMLGDTICLKYRLKEVKTCLPG